MPDWRLVPQAFSAAPASINASHPNPRSPVALTTSMVISCKEVQALASALAGCQPQPAPGRGPSAVSDDVTLRDTSGHDGTLLTSCGRPDMRCATKAWPLRSPRAMTHRAHDLRALAALDAIIGAPSPT